jgi:YD repeat-containing protein
MKANTVNNYLYDLAGNIANSGLIYDADGNLTSDGKNTYEYDKQNRLIKGTNADGETSEYIYNALGNRVGTIENKKNPNYSARTRGYKNGSELFPDYTEVFKFGRAFDQKTWETDTGAIMQNEFITVEKSYLIDLTSPANRDIFVNEKGAYTQRYVYGIDGKRISAEFDYAENTHRGESGENTSSDKAVEIGKIYYRFWKIKEKNKWKRKRL